MQILTKLIIDGEEYILAAETLPDNFVTASKLSSSLNMSVNNYGKRTQMIVDPDTIVVKPDRNGYLYKVRHKGEQIKGSEIEKGTITQDRLEESFRNRIADVLKHQGSDFGLAFDTLDEMNQWIQNQRVKDNILVDHEFYRGERIVYSVDREPSNMEGGAIFATGKVNDEYFTVENRIPVESADGRLYAVVDMAPFLVEGEDVGVLTALELNIEGYNGVDSQDYKSNPRYTVIDAGADITTDVIKAYTIAENTPLYVKGLGEHIINWDAYYWDGTKAVAVEHQEIDVDLTGYVKIEDLEAVQDTAENAKSIATNANEAVKQKITAVEFNSVEEMNEWIRGKSDHTKGTIVAEDDQMPLYVAMSGDFTGAWVNHPGQWNDETGDYDYEDFWYDANLASLTIKYANGDIVFYDLTGNVVRSGDRIYALFPLTKVGVAIEKVEGYFAAGTNTYYYTEIHDNSICYHTVPDDIIHDKDIMNEVAQFQCNIETNTNMYVHTADGYDVYRWNGSKVLPYIIGDEQIDSKHIKSGAIQSRHLPDEVVTFHKIGKEQVNTSRIAKYAVTSDRVAPKAIWGTHINDGAIGRNKLGDDVKAILDNYEARIAELEAKLGV